MRAPRSGASSAPQRDALVTPRAGESMRRNSLTLVYMALRLYTLAGERGASGCQRRPAAIFSSAVPSVPASKQHTKTRKAVHNKRIAGRGPYELTRTARIPPASCPAPPDYPAMEFGANQNDCNSAEATIVL
eukprot:scaffold41469_cov62-Phaeocystis_antarctica.AAC.1